VAGSALLVFIGFLDKPAGLSWEIGAFLALIAAVAAAAPVVGPAVRSWQDAAEAELFSSVDVGPEYLGQTWGGRKGFTRAGAALDPATVGRSSTYRGKRGSMCS
jgi:hypothetical protein